jgi:hypothetical protein
MIVSELIEILKTMDHNAKVMSLDDSYYNSYTEARKVDELVVGFDEDKQIQFKEVYIL